MAEPIKLGDRVKDIYSEFEGIAVARYQFLYGCDRICVQPTKLHEGKLVESYTFDVPQLVVLEPEVPRVSENAAGEEQKTGGPQPNERTARRADPKR